MANLPAWQPELQENLERVATTLEREQLLWASGYFAGRAAAGAAPERTASQPAPAAAPAASETLHIWYGSQTGNARGVAERLAHHARGRGLAVKLASLEDVRPQQIRKLKLLSLVVSTHGEGDPPEDAEALHEYLHGDNAPKLDGLRYAVFGLGDSTYEYFCQTGKDFDQALARLGGKAVLERVDADLDYEEREGGWSDKLLERVAGEAGNGDSPAPRPQLQVVGGEPPAASHWTRSRPFSAEILAANPLTVAPAGKSVHHLELSLEGSGMQYRPGDSVGVWPRNAETLVDEVLALAGLDGGEPVSRDGETLSAREWLARRLELTQVSRTFLADYAEAGGQSELKALLEDADALRRWLAGHQIADVLRQFPTALPGEELVALLKKLRPRLYSIASSALETPGEVHLTVATEGGWRERRLRAGAATWHLNETLKAGDSADIYVEENPRFRLPRDPDTAVIMIGPGTGVAPFRAFVQERAARGDAGRNWLFFGDRHRRASFLYQLEWQRHLRDGHLSRLSVAFSRDRAEKVHVQDRIRAQGRDFVDWLESGAHVYLCGDAKRMAPDVDRTIRDVVGAQLGLSEEQSAEYVKTLRREGRYQKDVY